jgi:hypothetical protein
MKSIINFFKKVFGSKTEVVVEAKKEDTFCEVVKKEKPKAENVEVKEKKAPAKRIKRDEN